MVAGVQGSHAEIYGNANLTQIYYASILSNGGCGLYIDGPTPMPPVSGLDIASTDYLVFTIVAWAATRTSGTHRPTRRRDGLCSFSEDGVVSWRYYVRDAYRRQ